jgi:hypothetical protein
MGSGPYVLSRSNIGAPIWHQRSSRVSIDCFQFRGWSRSHMALKSYWSWPSWGVAAVLGGQGEKMGIQELTGRNVHQHNLPWKFHVLVILMFLWIQVLISWKLEDSTHVSYSLAPISLQANWKMTNATLCRHSIRISARWPTSYFINFVALITFYQMDGLTLYLIGLMTHIKFYQTDTLRLPYHILSCWRSISYLIGQ